MAYQFTTSPLEHASPLVADSAQHPAKRSSVRPSGLGIDSSGLVAYGDIPGILAEFEGRKGRKGRENAGEIIVSFPKTGDST